MSVKITADSTCDLSRQLIEEKNITLMPLTIVKGDQAFLDGQTILPRDIFAHVDGGGSLCSTAARSPEEYRQMFEPLAERFESVVHVSLGSGFSASYQNACLGAEGFANVFVVDSQNLSTGQGHIVMEACRMAEEGLEGQELAQQLEALTGRVEASFLLDRLDYMVKGGRCSAVTALGANLLRLKPCIEVSGGKMRVCKKYRGSYERCMQAYVTDRIGGARDDILRERLFITHTPVPETVLETVRSAVAESPAFQQVVETEAGCTVSCHCGPGTLGVLFIRQD